MTSGLGRCYTGAGRIFGFATCSRSLVEWCASWPFVFRKLACAERQWRMDRRVMCRGLSNTSERLRELCVLYPPLPYSRFILRPKSNLLLEPSYFMIRWFLVQSDTPPTICFYQHLHHQPDFSVFLSKSHPVSLPHPLCCPPLGAPPIG